MMKKKTRRRRRTQSEIALDYWRGIFAYLEALPSCASETRVVTDRQGHATLERRPQTFVPR